MRLVASRGGIVCVSNICSKKQLNRGGLLQWILFLLLMVCGTPLSMSQTAVSLQNGQWLEVDGCASPTGVIYDNGGPDNIYMNNFDGGCVITVQPGMTITLTGSYITESNYDRLYIYDGYRESGTLLVDGVSGSSTVSLTSTTGYLSIWFHSDVSVQYAGFAFQYTVTGFTGTCPNAVTDLTVGTVTQTTAALSWTTGDATRPLYLTVNGEVSLVTGSSTLLTGLAAGRHYDVTLVDTSNGSVPCCYARTSFHTECADSVEVPLVELFDDYGTGVDVLPGCWTRLSNYDDDQNQPQICASPDNSSAGVLRMYCGSNAVSNHFSLAIGPEITADIATLQARLYIRSAYAGATVQVGVCEGTSLYTSQFVSVATLTVNTANQWEEHLVPLSSYTGTGRRIAIRMERGMQPSNGLVVWVDDLSVESCGVRNVEVYDRSHRSVWLRWDTYGTPSQVDLEIGPRHFVAGTGRLMTAVTSPLLVEGLEPGTEYEFRLTAHCNGGSEAVADVTATGTTLDATVAGLNYCEGFETSGSLLPAGWRAVSDGEGGGWSGVQSGRVYNGTGALWMSASGYHPMRTLVLPVVDTVATRSLKLSMRFYPAVGCELYVGVMESPENLNSFTPVDTFVVTNEYDWTEWVVDFSRYTGSGSWIALRLYDWWNNNTYYIDNLMIATCMLSGVGVTNVTSNSAEVRWNVEGSFLGDSVRIMYGAPGFDENTASVLTVAVEPTAGTQTVTVGGLASNSDYEFLVYGLCDTMVQHCDMNRHLVHTLDHDLLLPYCVDFEQSGTLPEGWTSSMSYGVFPRVDGGPGAAHSGERCLEMESYGALGGGNSMVALPLLETSDLSGVVVSFQAWSECADNYVQVGVMEVPGEASTFVPVATLQLSTGQWRRYAVPLTAYTGTGRYVAFRKYMAGSCYSGSLVRIDDVTVSGCQTVNIRPTEITSHSVTLVWDSVGTAYNGAVVEIGRVGFVQGSGTTSAVVRGGRLTIDTLETGTTYDYFVHPQCNGESAACNSDRYGFSTLDEAVVSNWCCDFDHFANNTLPVTWGRPSVYNGDPQLVEDWSASGTRSVRLQSSGSARSVLVLPPIEESDLTGLTLRMKVKGSYDYACSCRLIVGLMSDGDNLSSFEGLDTLDLTHSDFRDYSFNLGAYAGSGRRPAFVKEGAYTAWIDDLAIGRCFTDSVKVFNVTTTAARVAWHQSTETDSVTVVYSGMEGGQYVTHEVTAAQAPIEISGLVPGVDYVLQVQAHCDSATQHCSNESVSFTTGLVPVADGYCQDFTTGNPAGTDLPTGWRKVQTHSDSEGGSWPLVRGTYTDPRYYTSASYALEFKSSTTGCVMAAMPAAEDSVQGLVVSFNMRCQTTAHPERSTLEVGVMEETADASTFTPVDTLHPEYSWTRYAVDLSGYSGTGRYIAFRYSDDASRYTYVDDVSITHCQAVGVRSYAVTDQSLRLRWNRKGYSGTTHIAYGPESNFTLAGAMRLHCADTTIAVTGLTPGESYRFLLWGDCQDTLSVCQATAATVQLMDQPMEAPACFDFENGAIGTLPVGWTQPYGGIYPSLMNLIKRGSQSMVFRTYDCNGSNEDMTSMVVTPMVEAADFNALYLDFWWFPAMQPTSAQLVVGVMDDPYDTSSFVAVDTFRTTYMTWSHLHSSFANYSGTGRYIAFRFEGLGGCDHGLGYLDDVNLRSCQLTEWTAGNPTLNSIDLSWEATAGVDSVWVEYHIGTGDFTPGSGTTVTLRSADTTLGGLAEATWYTFHFYPACEAVNDGCNYETAICQTLHPAVDVPYCENFEGYSAGSYLDNWRALSTVDGSPVVQSGVNRGTNGSQSLRLSYDGSGEAMAIMPRLRVSADCPMVDSLYANFWMYSSSTHAALVVGVVSDASDATTFVSTGDTLRMEAATAAPTAGWQHHTVALRQYASLSTQVAFRLISDDSSAVEVYIDDLCMEKCVAANVTLSDVTQHSVTVTWDSYGVDSLVCEYGPSGFAAGSGTVVTLDASPAVIDGLEHGTEYDFVFASVCGCHQYGATYYADTTGPAGSDGFNWHRGGRHGWGWYVCDSVAYTVYDTTAHCDTVWNPAHTQYQYSCDTLVRTEIHYMPGHDTVNDIYYWCWGWGAYGWATGGSGGYGPTVTPIVTQAQELQFPYCQDFEGDTVGFPPSWRRIGGTVAGYPSLTSATAHSGEQSLDLYAQPGSQNIVSLPPIPVGETPQGVLTFYAYSNNVNATGDNARLIVGTMSDPDNDATFSPIDTLRLDAIGRWQQFVVDLAGSNIAHRYVSIRFAPYNGAYHCYIDDLFLGRCATGGTTVTTRDDTVVLHWTAYHNPAYVDIEYGPQGFQRGEGLLLTVAGDSCVVDGIDPTGSYDFYVGARCDDTSDAQCHVKPVTLNPAMVMPWCEDFESLPVGDNGVVPEHWQVVQRHGNNSYAHYPQVELQYTDRQVMTFYSGTGSNSNTVQLPVLAAGDSLTGKWVHVCMASQAYNYISLDFGYLRDSTNANTFTQMGSIRNLHNNQLERFNVQLTGLDTVHRLAIRARSTSGTRWIRLDELSVGNYPVPLNVRIGERGATTFHVAWDNSHGNAYYSVVCMHDGVEETFVSDSCEVLLGGLQPETDYTIQFVTPGGERQCQQYAFRTSSAQQVPYCNDFQEYSDYDVPQGWSRISGTNCTDRPRVGTGNQGGSGNSYLYFQSNCNPQLFALPEFEVADVTSMQLTFDMLCTGYYNTQMLRVGVMSDRNDRSTFVPVDTLRCTNNGEWQHREVTFDGYTGNGTIVAFDYLNNGAGNYGIFVDDVKVRGCVLPQLTVTGSHEITAVSPENSQVDYYIEMADHPFEQGAGDTVIHVTESPFRLTGLTANTSYSLYLRCDSVTPTCEDAVTVTTPNMADVPVCDNFNTYGTGNEAFPTGWQRFTTTGSYNNLRIDQSNSSSYYAIHFRNNMNNDCYVVMPDLDVDSIRRMELYYLMASEDRRYTALVVGVMDDPADLSTFVPVDTVANSTNNSGVWEWFHTSLQSYQGTGRFVAFRQIVFNSSGNTYRQVYLDCMNAAPFPRPDVTLADWNSVRVSVDPLVADDFWLAYGPHGFVPGDSVPEVTPANDTVWHPAGVRMHVFGNDTLLTGLAADSEYDFYAWRSGDYVPCAACAGYNFCNPVVTIRTSRLQPLPLCDDFDTYGTGAAAMPPGWLRYHSYSSYAAGSGNEWPRVAIGYDSRYVLRFYNHRDYISYAVLPDLEVDSLQEVNLYLSMRTGDYRYQRLEVGVTGNPAVAAAFQPVDTLVSNDNSWHEYHVSLAGYQGTGRFIALRAVETSGNWRYLDVDYLQVQACSRPQFTLVDHNTVRIEVDNGSQTTLPAADQTDYWVAYGATDTVRIHVTQNPFYLTQLQSNTTYAFFAACDSATVAGWQEGGSACGFAASVTTSEQHALPWCEDFNAYNSASLPSGWSGIASSSAYPQLSTNSSFGGTGRSLLLNASNSANSYCLAMMPEPGIDSLQKIWLTFQFQPQNGYANYVNMEVGVMSNPADRSSFVAVDTVSNSHLGYEAHQVGFARYEGAGRFVAFRELNTSAYNRDAYIDNIIVERCHIPSDIRATLVDHNRVRVDAEQQTVTGFFVEYGTTGFAQGTGQVVRCDTLPLFLTLENQTTYDFYFTCDTTDATCRPMQQVTTLEAPLSLPVCLYADSLSLTAAAGTRVLTVLPPVDADSLEGLVVSLYLSEESAGVLELGVMSDPYDANTFLPTMRLQGSSGRRLHLTSQLLNVPGEARFLALRLSASATAASYYVDHLNLSYCGTWNVHVASVESDYIALDWQQAGTPDISVEYGPTGFTPGSGTTVSVTTPPPFLLTEVSNLTGYDICFHSRCVDALSDSCGVNYDQCFSVFTPGGGTGCIDPTNLTADYTTCYYGSFANPRASTGIIDYGFSDPLSRHTVHYDTTETDPRTGDLLHTVPDGAEASVRLGNWNSNTADPEAESVEYSLYVDPASFDLLILRYAAVLQDPMHATADQPRFTLEILNADHQLISQCGSADFRADYSLGWNLVPATNVLWKDWTTVGIDMSDYSNQTVFVRLTTYDCNEGSHYGYAYFTLGCTLKSMQSAHCGEVDDNTFSAPSGFAYTWYTNPDSIAQTTFSTAQTITVATNNNLTYYCDCAFIDNPNCKFTLSAFAGTRYPLALATPSVSVHDCKFYVSFANNSTISVDGVTPLGSGEACETAQWFFGNGESSTSYNASTVFEDTGSYTVVLVSGIAGNSCTDTLRIPLRLDWTPSPAIIEGLSDICWGDTLTLTARNIDNLEWSIGSVDSSIVVTPLQDSAFLCRFVNASGCNDSLTHVVRVHPHYDIHDTVVICQNDIPYSWRDTVINVDLTDSSPFVILDPKSSSYGCDSLLTLHLTVNFNSYASLYDSIVENQLPYTFLGTTFSDAGRDTLHTVNAAGCDSIVDFSLYVHRNSITIFDTAVCDNMLPLQWRGFSFFDAGTVYDTLLSVFGSDSVIQLNLALYPTYRFDDTMSTCRNAFPYSWRDTVIYADSTFSSSIEAYYSRFSINGCDSLLALHLTVGQVYAFADTAELCADALPYIWRDTVVGMPATLPAELSIVRPHLTLFGCDSTHTLALTVHPLYDIQDTVVICQDDLPYTWRDTVIQVNLSDSSWFVIQNPKVSVYGCDSLLTLHLTVNANTAASVHEYVVENALPYTYHGLVCHSDTGQVQVVMTNVNGCDSVVDYSLTVWRNVLQPVERTVCDDLLPLQWNARTFTAAGLQYDTLSASTGADSIVAMTLYVNPTYRFDDTLRICRNELPFTWRDTSFAVDAPTGYYNRPFHTVAGCDSILSLSLHISDVYQMIDHIESCNPITWIDGLTYGARTFGPTVTLTSRAGCDSVVKLDFVLLPPALTGLTDSFCVNTTYTFAGHTISLPGIYYDTLQTVDGCDSILQLALTQLKLPETTVQVDPDCEMRGYMITLHSNVDYHRWSLSDGRWNNAWGPRESSQIWVNPSVPVELTLLSDYYEQTTCPSTQTLALNPVVVPDARMSVTPEQLTDDDDNFIAIDHSSGALTRVWWVDDIFYGDDVRIWCRPDDGLDSVVVTLIALSEHCNDTAVQVIPIFHNTLFAPNAFTPDESTNNTFRLFMNGIIDFELTLFNREGLQLFHTTDPEESWDGTYLGKPCPQASYVWILKYTTNDKPHQPQIRKGTVTLLR